MRKLWWEKQEKRERRFASYEEVGYVRILKSGLGILSPFYLFIVY